MSKSAVSVFAFSIYMFLLGLTLIVIPNVLLRLFSVPETSEVWIRVVGMLVLILGFYYSHAARNDLRAFFGWTVVARTSVLLFFIAFVVAGFAPPVLIVFGVIDFAAAMWTLLALKSEAQA
jgi:hypothetical protein